MTEPQYLTVGRVLRPHGVRGELLLETLTDFPEALPGKTIYVQQGGDPPRPLQVISVRQHRHQLLISFEGYFDRESVEAFREALLLIETSQAQPLAEGQYYHHQIVGLRAVTEDAQPLGQVEEILETGANDVYLVRTPDGRELLLPAIKDVVKKIDLDAGEIVVHLLEGLAPPAGTPLST